MTESGLDHKAKGAEAETPRRGRVCALGGGGLVLWGRGCALLTVFLDPGDAKLGPSSAQGPPRRRYLKGERVCFLSLKAKGSCRLAGQPVVKGTCEKKRSVENGAWLRTGTAEAGDGARPPLQRLRLHRGPGVASSTRPGPRRLLWLLPFGICLTGRGEGSPRSRAAGRPKRSRGAKLPVTLLG